MAMMLPPLFILGALALAGATMPLRAQEITSTYTDLAVDDKCVTFTADEIGANLACPGLGGYGVVFSEYDLRTSIFYGFVGPWYGEGAFETFETFNSVGDTLEWRLADGVPYATILRWFIEHTDPQTGNVDEANRGQILVISKVAQPGIGEACIVGYVDARANEDANEIARQVADTITEGFRCIIDEPVYHGEEGLLSGYPSRTFGP